MKKFYCFLFCLLLLNSSCRMGNENPVASSKSNEFDSLAIIGELEETDLYLFIDYGLTGDLNNLCYLINGEIPASPMQIEAVFDVNFDVLEAPSKQTFKFNVENPKEKYVIKIFSKGDANNTGVVSVNGNKVGRFVNSLRNLTRRMFDNDTHPVAFDFEDRITTISGISLKEENEIEVLTSYARNEKDLNLTLLIYPENIITKHCYGKPVTLNQNLDSKWKSLEKPFISEYTGSLFYKKTFFDERKPELKEYKSALRTVKTLHPIFFQKYQVDKQSIRYYLTEEPNLLKNSAKIIASSENIKAISFSSPRALYVYTVLNDFKLINPQGDHPEFIFAEDPLVNQEAEHIPYYSEEQLVENYINEAKELVEKSEFISALEAIKKAEIIDSENKKVQSLIEEIISLNQNSDQSIEN